MSEKMRESLSALMDDEANELELERVLANIGNDEELRQAWLRYHVASDAASGQAQAYMERDISKQVQAAIGVGAAADIPDAASGFRQRVLRPLTSFAVAASVAATVVIGGQQLAQVGAGSAPDSEWADATRPSPVGLVNTLGATTVQASYGTQSTPVLQPVTRKAYQELANKRMGRYMQEHAEHAALNSPQGLIPFARVPQIKE